MNFVVAQNYMTTEGLGADGVVAGMQMVLPGAVFQFRFIPEASDELNVDAMVDEALGSRQIEGFVLVRAPPFEKTVLAIDCRPSFTGLRIRRNKSLIVLIAGTRHGGAACTDYLLSRGAGADSRGPAATRPAR